ncbi:hypothetical protein [Candidatus Avelusimicrobium sp.]|uniref:hypothetical protein n=1 Tax=Candidatus Avelusimicrobium sp. TaxID=3048833 RepID=UPI003D7EE904
MTNKRGKAVIPEGCSRESVFAVVVLLRNDRSPTKFLGDDDNSTTTHKVDSENPAGRQFRMTAHMNNIRTPPRKNAL